MNQKQKQKRKSFDNQKLNELYSTTVKVSTSTSMSSSSSLNMIGWLIGSRALNTNTKVSPRGSREEGKNCNLKYIYGAPRTHSSVPGFWIIWQLWLYSSLVSKNEREMKKKIFLEGNFFNWRRGSRKSRIFLLSSCLTNKIHFAVECNSGFEKKIKQTARPFDLYSFQCTQLVNEKHFF